MKISAVLAFTFVLILSSTLKIRQENHAYTDVNEYLNQLADQQGKFEAGVGILKQSVEETALTAQGVDDIEEKIKILEAGILEQEDQVYLTSVDMIPSIVLKDQCCTLSEEDISRIVTKCEGTIQDIKALSEKLNGLEADAKVLEMRASANYQIYYLETIQNVLNGNCT